MPDLRLEVPTSLRGYLPGTENDGNTIRVGWEPSSGYEEEEEVTEAAPQVGTYLKGQSHEIFCTRFFPPNSSSWSH